MTSKPNKIEEPKDLGVKIGSPAMILWTGVVAQLKIGIKKSEDELTVNKAMLEMAEITLAEETQKFKS